MAIFEALVDRFSIKSCPDVTFKSDIWAILKNITFQVETAVDTFWPLLEKPEKLVYFLLQFLGLLGVTNTVVWHVLVTQLAPSAPS